MDTIDSLLQWAADEGVVLDGIRPSSIPGRGLGMVATRVINVRTKEYTFETDLLTC